MAESETQRIPALLWDSLQDVCYKHDVAFINEVARMIGVPAADIRKRVLGVRGMPTAITVERGPWWQGAACPWMECSEGGMWRRCGQYCEAHGACWKHRKGGERIYDDPYFLTLPKRVPVSIDDEIYYVDCEGAAYSVSGLKVIGLHVNLEDGSASYDGDEK